ncbi:MAG: PBP1A family penicillin-binding protein, partial [Chloroflexi bacterium]|nr:PBP1A family penicillin-binding protein [Chloroflexota bacterium]
MVFGTNGNGNAEPRREDGLFSKPARSRGVPGLHARAQLRSRRQRRLKRRGYKGLLVFGALVSIGSLTFALLILLGAIHGAMSAYASINRDLPSINQISSGETFKTAQIFDRKGTLLWEFYDQEGGKRTVVPLSEVSQYLIDAQLAAEDANFYSNPGVDLRGIARAVFQNMAEQDVISGASTVTQQLVRNVLLKPEERYDRSVGRKIKEALLAYQVTQKLSKSQILALYLNEIYYGNLSYGVEAASQTYFAKNARDLSLAEAAVIAGLPASPSLYDPLRNPAGAKARQTYVLDQMVRHGFVSEQEAREARQAELRYQPRKRVFLAPHWVMYVRDLVEAKYGSKLLYQGGLKIYTSLDLDLQNRMEEVARSNSEVLAQRDANNTSITVMNPKTGELLAVVGSMDYWNVEIEGQVNVASSQRQPGSTIKPLVYLSAFAKGYTPATTVVDEKISIPDDLGRIWTPENFDRRFRGTVTLRSALGNSLNIPAVKVLQYAGIDAVADLAKRMGITTWTERNRLGPSMSLGGAEVRPLDITAAYTVLANNGLKIPQVAVTKIVDADGNIIEDYKVPQGEQIVDPRYAYMLTNVLSDNNARLATFGPNSLLNMPRPVAVKTGTTDNYRDTWTIGYMPNLTVGVWVGNTDNHPMKEVLSSMSAGKVWREATDAAINHLSLPPEEFVRPQGLVEIEVCGDTQMRPNQPPCYKDLFPFERAPNSQRVQIGPAAAPSPQPGGAPARPAPGQPAPNQVVPVQPAAKPAA